MEEFFAPLIEQAHQPGHRAGNGARAGLVAGHGGFRDAEETGELVHCEVMLDTDLAEVC